MLWDRSLSLVFDIVHSSFVRLFFGWLFFNFGVILQFTAHKWIFSRKWGCSVMIGWLGVDDSLFALMRSKIFLYFSVSTVYFFSPMLNLFPLIINDFISLDCFIWSLKILVSCHCLYVVSCLIYMSLTFNFLHLFNISLFFRPDVKLNFSELLGMCSLRL